MNMLCIKVHIVYGHQSPRAALGAFKATWQHERRGHLRAYPPTGEWSWELGVEGKAVA